MPFLTNRGVLMVALEGTEGASAISPVPAATDAIVVNNVSVAITGNEVERKILDTKLSPFGFVVAERSAQLTFTTEFRGNGTIPSAGAPLATHPLWMAAGYSPTYSASSAVYNPKTDQASSGTSATACVYAYIDGILHVIKGGRANAVITCATGAFPSIAWTLQGVYGQLPSTTASGPGVDIGDATLPTASFDAGDITMPAPALGMSINVHGFSAVIQQLTVDLGNVITPRPDISASNGIRGFLITDRMAKGSINPEAVARGGAGHDFWRRWEQGLRGVLVAYINGTGLGNSVHIDAPQAQYHVPTWADRNGIRVYDVNLEFVRGVAGTGDDELSFSFLS